MAAMSRAQVLALTDGLVSVEHSSRSTFFGIVGEVFQIHRLLSWLSLDGTVMCTSRHLKSTGKHGLVPCLTISPMRYGTVKPISDLYADIIGLW